MRGASVRVVSSYALPPVMDYYGLGATVASAPQMDEVKKAYLDGLRVVVERCAHLYPRVGIDYAALDRSTVAMLLEESVDSSLLVVGSSGAGAVRAFLLGSVTSAVLHDSACPVVVVPANTSGAELALPLSTGHVAVGVDDSEQSDKAVTWAADEADRRGGQLLVVHAWEYPYRPISEPVGGAMDLARVDAALVLDRAVEQAQDRCGVTVEGMLVEGSPAQALLDASATADLVVMGSRGRGGFKSMMLGSVTQAVTAHAACPVVVVR